MRNTGRHTVQGPKAVSVKKKKRKKKANFFYPLRVFQRVRMTILPGPVPFIFVHVAIFSCAADALSMAVRGSKGRGIGSVDNGKNPQN